MSSITIAALYVLIIYLGSLIAFRLGGLRSVLLYAVIVNAAAFLTALLSFEAFGQMFFLGSIFYASSYFFTDLIEEYYGKGKARNLAWLIFFTRAVILLFAEIALLGEATNPEIAAALEVMIEPWRAVIIASFVFYIILQYWDTWFYEWIHNHTGEKHLWLRNNASTLSSQLMDAFIAFPVIWKLAFPELSWGTVLAASAASMGIKIILTITDTPFLYLSRWMKPEELRQ